METPSNNWQLEYILCYISVLVPSPLAVRDGNLLIAKGGKPIETGRFVSRPDNPLSTTILSGPDSLLQCISLELTEDTIVSNLQL